MEQNQAIRVTAAFASILVLFATTGFPVPSALVKPGEDFPCKYHHCGCLNAEMCRLHCCCRIPKIVKRTPCGCPETQVDAHEDGLSHVAAGARTFDLVIGALQCNGIVTDAVGTGITMFPTARESMNLRPLSANHLDIVADENFAPISEPDSIHRPPRNHSA